MLKEAGLVAERPRGTLRIYRLQEQGVEVVQGYLRQVWRPPRFASRVTEPLSLSFDVACSAEHAFATWAERIGSWWPADHP